MWARMKHFLTSTALVFRRISWPPTGVGLDGVAIAFERGLEPALRPAGLKAGAKILGRNSWLLGFNFAAI